MGDYKDGAFFDTARECFSIQDIAISLYRWPLPLQDIYTYAHIHIFLLPSHAHPIPYSYTPSLPPLSVHCTSSPAPKVWIWIYYFYTILHLLYIPYVYHTSSAHPIPSHPVLADALASLYIFHMPPQSSAHATPCLALPIQQSFIYLRYVYRIIYLCLFHLLVACRSSY